MKRFYKEAGVVEIEDGWAVALDGRQIKTSGGAQQVVPTRRLAELLAAEWNAQGEKIDAATLPLRDLTDYAIDVVAPDRDAAITSILPYAETDTLCYRADPDEPLFQRQQELWEPVLQSLESRHNIRLERVSGIVHRPQPEMTMQTFRGLLEDMDSYTLTAAKTLASLAASLSVAFMALEGSEDAEDLWKIANLEEDWQAEQWGWDIYAEERRNRKMGEFARAMNFARQTLSG